jgi:hypothetical protein
LLEGRNDNEGMKLTQRQLEAHLWGAANILRGKTAGQDYKNYILSLMFYKRLCDQWENEVDEAIAELERQQSCAFTEKQKAVFRTRGEHRFSIPDGSRWGDILAVSEGTLTRSMSWPRGQNGETALPSKISPSIGGSLWPLLLYSDTSSPMRSYISKYLITRNDSG